MDQPGAAKAGCCAEHAVGENAACGIDRLLYQCAGPAWRRTADREGKWPAHPQTMGGAENARHEYEGKLDHGRASTAGPSSSNRASVSELVTTRRLLMPIATAATTGCSQPAAARPMPATL